MSSTVETVAIIYTLFLKPRVKKRHERGLGWERIMGHWLGVLKAAPALAEEPHTVPGTCRPVTYFVE